MKTDKKDAGCAAAAARRCRGLSTNTHNAAAAGYNALASCNNTAKFKLVAVKLEFTVNQTVALINAKQHRKYTRA